MPNSKSALKSVKTDAIRNSRNKAKKSAIHTFEKRFKSKVMEKDFEGAKECLKKTMSLYDKAAKTGTFHKNRADRKKSRLTTLLNQVVNE